MKKRIIVGITAPQSIDLLKGQLNYFKDKYEVFLLAPETPEVIEFCNIEGATLLPIQIKRELSPIHDVKTLIQIIKIFKKIKPDVVNLGTPKVSLLGMTAAKLLGIKHRIYTCRGFRYEHEKGFFKRFLMLNEKFIALCSHNVICISNSIKELGVKDGIFAKDKTIHIGKGSSNGINLEIFSPSQVNEEQIYDLRKKYQLNGFFVFGYVGRLVDRKGIKELYEAYDLVYRKDNRCKLLVVGRPYYDQISDRSLIEKYNNHPGIIMLGLQPANSIPLFLSLFDTFVLPAWWEGFGNVLIQAAAMGVPIISNRVTGCKDAVLDGYNGVLLEKGSHEQLKEAMLYFMNHPEKIKKYGQNGLEWARHFKPEIIWEGQERLYKNYELVV